MTLHNFTSIFMYFPRVLFLSLTGLGLSSCGFLFYDENLRERMSNVEPSLLKTIDNLSVMMTKGSYKDIGTQIGRAIGPDVEVLVSSSAKARKIKSSNQLLGTAQARTNNAIMAMSANFADFSGTANEIDSIAAAAKQEKIKAWDAVDLGYGPEVGASGFGVTDGQQALLGKVIGVPLAAYLSEPKERAMVAQPNVQIYNPSNGMSYMIASWPLATHPVVGLNKRGLAMSVTSFAAGSPQIHSELPFEYRRVLQTSTSVKQALRKLYTAKRLDTGATIVLADHSGALAHVECSVERCIEIEVFDMSMGQVSHAAHAISSLGLGVETPNSSFSEMRLQSLKRQMAKQGTDLGTIVGMIRTLRLLESTTGVAANSQAMALVVVDPRRQTLWHSVGHVPSAAAGRIIEIGFNGPTGNELPGLSVPQEISATLEMLENAESQYLSGNYEAALTMLDDLPQSPALDSYRLSYFRGLILSQLGKHRDASEFAMAAVAQNYDANLSAYALALQAWNLAQLGDRSATQRILFDALQLAELSKIQDSLRQQLQRGNLPATLDQYPTLLLY